MKQLLRETTITHITEEIKFCKDAYNKKLYYYTEIESFKILGMIDLASVLDLITDKEYEDLRDEAYTINVNSVINR